LKLDLARRALDEELDHAIALEALGFAIRRNVQSFDVDDQFRLKLQTLP